MPKIDQIRECVGEDSQDEAVAAIDLAEQGAGERGRLPPSAFRTRQLGGLGCGFSPRRIFDQVSSIKCHISARAMWGMRQVPATGGDVRRAPAD